VGFGGKNASLATICDGNGGQQNKQQISLNVNPFILHAFALSIANFGIL
jgi:hypothetical protein